MCGIVGAVAQRDVAEILVEGLRRLEYRGYDSAGVAVFSANQPLQRVRRLGKVAELAKALEEQSVHGGTGIAHTRWATHGEPSERNAHPHVSEHIVVVHNGIIENHEELREELKALGYVFSSDTDTEVIAHLVHHELKSAPSLLAAMQVAVKQLRGAYGTVVMDSRDDSRVVVARSGSPLVIGRGIGENFIASDQMALLPVTRRFIFLEEGDVAEVTRRDVHIFDTHGEAVVREELESELSHDAGDKGEYRHYMLKEIYEQPKAITNTLEGRLGSDHVVVESFGNGARAIFDKVEHVQIVACGTSYNSGMVARYWFEEIAGVSCDVEIASEFRYRKSVVRPNSLLVTLSQSGETADTLAALRLAKESGYMSSLAICNVPGSSLVRESDLAFMTRAGAEIGRQAFGDHLPQAITDQLTALRARIDALARQDHALGPTLTHKPGQRLRAATAAQQADGRLGHGQLGVGLGDADVACQRALQAASHCKTVDGRDHHGPRVLQRFKRGTETCGGLPGHIAVAIGKGVQVSARAEELRPVAGDDDGAHACVGVQAFDGGLQLQQTFRRQCVGRRALERQQGNGALMQRFQFDHHASPSFR